MNGATYDKIVSKVQGLLAKAESTTFPEEAEALFAKAQELMARYAIDEAIARQRKDPGKPGMRKLKVDAPYASAKLNLLSAVGHANHVHVVSNGLGGATLFGFDADLETAVLLFTSLLVQATQSMLRVPREESGRGIKAFRHAFLIGYASRIGGRLREERRTVEREATTSEPGLVPLFEARRDAVDALVREEFPRLRTRRSSVSDYGGASAGMAAANRADLGMRGRVSSGPAGALR